MSAKSKKLEGYNAFLKGKSIEDNPYKRLPKKYISSSAWWESGFQKARRETLNDRI